MEHRGLDGVFLGARRSGRHDAVEIHEKAPGFSLRERREHVAHVFVERVEPGDAPVGHDGGSWRWSN
jgi:hypothetical protein